MSKTLTKSRKPKQSPAAAPAANTVLVLRTCKADMTSYEGFKWPASGPVECKDWKPIKQCGNGLHGFKPTVAKGWQSQ